MIRFFVKLFFLAFTVRANELQRFQVRSKIGLKDELDVTQNRPEIEHEILQLFCKDLLCNGCTRCTFDGEYYKDENKGVSSKVNFMIEFKSPAETTKSEILENFDEKLEDVAARVEDEGLTVPSAGGE